MTGQTLITASAAVILLLGTLHLYYTFFSHKFHSRDRSLQAALETVSPVISAQTTLWRSMVGFNASHSIGAILFGLVYGYLASWHFAFLLASPFLAVVGLLVLLGYAVLARLYWFVVPLAGISLALTLYVAGFILTLA